MKGKKQITDKGKVVVEKEKTLAAPITKRDVRVKMPHNAQNGIFALEERRKIVASRYLGGWSQWEIARELGVSQNVIQTDLEVLEKSWFERAVDDIEKLKRMELSKIDNLERMATEAYARSMGIEKTKITYHETNGDFSKDGERITKKRLIGDDRFMARIAWCVEMRCKILGITKEQAKVDVKVLTAINWQDIITDTSDSGAKSIEDEIRQLEILGESKSLQLNVSEEDKQ